MGKAHAAIVEHIRQWACAGIVGGLADQELLRRYVQACDKMAFAVLLRRHAPMVWNAARRLLSQSADADDVLQAVFLLLARDAKALVKHPSLAGWLHETTCRLAKKAKASAVRRSRHEAQALVRRPADALAEITGRELLGLLDEELGRLPEKYRTPLVLCYLEGRAQDESARQMDCSLSSFKRRLERGRELLRSRLVRRGVTFPAAFLTTALTEDSTAAVPVSAVAATIKAAMELAAGKTMPSAVPVSVVGLMPGTGIWVAMGKPKVIALMLAALCVIGGVAVARVWTTRAASSQSETRQTQQGGHTAKTAQPLNKKPQRPDANPSGDPLPEGAIARLGSRRFRRSGRETGGGIIAFSVDGGQIATGTNAAVEIFDMASGRLVRQLKLPEDHYARMIRFLADGKRLAVGTANGNQAALTFFDIAQGTQISQTPFRGKANVLIGDITSDGERVLIEDRFVKAFLWDVKTATPRWEFPATSALAALALTNDEKQLVAAGSAQAELRDIVTGKVIANFPQPYRLAGFFGAAVAANGRLAMAKADRDGIAILDAHAPERARLLRVEKDTSRLRGLLFSRDSRYFVVLGQDKTLVWDLNAPGDRGPVASLPAASAAGFSPDGWTLALDDMGSITLWRVTNWKLLPQSADPLSPVTLVQFLPESKRVLGYTRQGWVTWPAAGGPATRISDNSNISPYHYAVISGDTRSAFDVLYEPGPTRDKDKHFVRVTDLVAAKAHRFPVEAELFYPLEVDWNGRHVAVFLRNRELVVLDAKTGKVVHREKRTVADRYWYGGDLAPDGQGFLRSATGAPLGPGRSPAGPSLSAVHIADHRTGRESRLEPVPWSIYVGGAKFSRDGSRLLLHAQFGRFSDVRADRVSVWNAATGRRICGTSGRAGHFSAALSDDGRTLLTGTSDGTLTLTEVVTGGERATFWHGGAILSVAFHPDGRSAVASSYEAPVYVWDLFGKTEPWSQTKAEQIWSDLASTNAKTAFAAIKRLRSNPAAAVVFLHDRLKLPAVPTEEEVAKLIQRLNSEQFSERTKAEKELKAVGDLVRPRLEEARKGASLETVRRLNQILTHLENPTPENLRYVRACEVLEAIRSPEAIQVLGALATGPPGARLTEEAKQSLVRLQTASVTRRN